MYPFFALGSAALYGAADFIGGMTARRADTMAVVIVSQAAGLLLVAILLLLFGTPVPGRADWWWGGAAGVTGGVGVALLYRALAVGVMSIVAPVTAVCAVGVPVVAAVTVMGERPPLQAALGIGIAILAIVLVSQSPPDAPHHGDSGHAKPIVRHSGVGLALASGIAIGLFFLALARTSADAGLWPLLFARVSSVTFFSALLMVSRRPLSMPRSVVATAAAGGVVDMLANLLYLLASRLGPLTLVVTLSSLYPASTVLLARFVLHERLTWRQWIGVAFALAAIVMIVTDGPGL
jgi:uncharacterized membrane protein